MKVATNETTERSTMERASHDNDNTEEDSEKITEAWIQHIIGRDWEIFWGPESTGDNQDRNANNSTQPQPKTKENDPQQHDLDGKETPSKRQKTGKESTEHKNGENDTSDLRKDDQEEEESDEDEEEEDETDWYAGHIKQFLRFEIDSDNPSQSQPVFQILFMGDEELYEMSLTPNIVRPCSRAWVRRTLALLDTAFCVVDSDNGNSVDNKSSPKNHKKAHKSISLKTPLQNQLPNDTRRLRDIEELDKLQTSVMEQFQAGESLHKIYGTGAAKLGFPEWNELLRIRELVGLIRQQIYLRSHLCPADIKTSRSASAVEDEEELEPSRSYVNFLVDRLESAARCCAWYDQCYLTLLEIYQKEAETNVNKDSVFRLFSEGGKQTMSELLSLDPSWSAFRRKRKKSSTQSPSSAKSSRRNKRRRKGTGIANFLVEEESGERFVNASSEDFFSSAFVKHLVQHLTENDPRWFSLSMGRMLSALLLRVVLPVLNWERQSQFYIGERDAFKIDDAKDLSTDEESDGEADSSKYITYKDIEKLVDKSKADRVLSRFDFAEAVNSLTVKMEDILMFEERCWTRLETIYSENRSSSSSNDDSDEELKGLQFLIDVSKRRDSAVGNVEPFGDKNARITRQVLDDAVVVRKWFLDLKHAESVRERVSFVEDVVASHESLPTLPCRKENERVGGGLLGRLGSLTLLLDEKKSLFDKHMALMEEKANEDFNDAESSLKPRIESLQSIRLIPVVEEMMLTRMDAASWLIRAQRVIGQTVPKFNDVAGIQKELDEILMGHSPRRMELVSSLRSNTKVDAEVRQFVQHDLNSFCKATIEKMSALYTTPAGWKERCDAIVSALKLHDNPAVSCCDNSLISTAKNTGMVDLKRIQDLLDEYPGLEVSLDAEFMCLRTAYEECIKWSDNITDLLMGDNTSFSVAMEAVEAANQPGGRPRGIIMNPTRQNLDTVVEMLRWHCVVKDIVRDKFNDLDTAFNLLVEGMDVVELYCERRQTVGQYSVKAEETLTLIRKRMDSKKPIRSFSRGKLGANEITEKLLLEMTDATRDESEGLPLFSLLLLAWRLKAEDYAQSFLEKTKSNMEYSLDSALEVRQAEPVSAASTNTLLFAAKSHWLTEFDRLVDEAEARNQQISTTLAAGKVILRDCLRSPDGVRNQTAALKEHLTAIKRDVSQKTMLALPRPIEMKVDKEVKLFSWLSRVIQYSDAFKDDDEQGPSSEVARIPWDILVKLNETRPDLENPNGDFALVLLRLKELYDEANKWQEEVSTQTMLSLRGGKRRSAPGDGGDDDDGQQMIDLAKVSAMSEARILKKVAMPREDAVRRMLENTKKFEVLLKDLLGKDYSGRHPDRINLPTDASLIDEDGRFILLRLTGSFLYTELKSSIDNIASVAADVLADTPGKATFDWIRKAVDWIEALSSCIDRDNIGHGQLSVQKSAVKDLLEMADTMLLDVPDDLRKTLSRYGIYASTNKEGKLTVKSKKGGAHHSVGITAIRWSPVLFEALKEDVGRTDDWEDRANELSTRCQQFMDSLPPTPEREVVLEGHFLLDEIEDLLGEAPELVVIPLKESVGAVLQHEADVSSFVKSHSTTDIDKEFAETVVNDIDAITEDRGLLLDSLVGRGMLVRKVVESQIASDGDFDQHYRDQARALISRALEEGVTAIATDIDQDGDTLGICKLKAWDIEESMFKFLQPKSEDKVSPRYREKVRSLRRAFGDLSNSTLCLQVVCGEIGPDKLVRMSSDQLANPKIRREREQIEARSKEKTILTRSHSKPTKNGTKDDGKEEEEEEGDLFDKKPAAKDSPRKTKTSAARHAEASAEQDKSPNLKRPARASGPPPPPPSLATTLRSRPTPSANPTHVLNASGNDHFVLTVSKIKFSASFFPTSPLRPDAESQLPENLNESFRTKIEEFKEFVSGKQKRNSSWDVYIMRLQPCSEADTREYKKFYKDFESNQRLAMFKLPNRNKLFLVTPKFHKDVKNVVQLDNSSSTYGILLLRHQ